MRQQHATPERSPVGTRITVATLSMGLGDLLGSTPEPPLDSPYQIAVLIAVSRNPIRSPDNAPETMEGGRREN